VRDGDQVVVGDGEQPLRGERLDDQVDRIAAGRSAQGSAGAGSAGEPAVGHRGEVDEEPAGDVLLVGLERAVNLFCAGAHDVGHTAGAVIALHGQPGGGPGLPHDEHDLGQQRQCAAVEAHREVSLA
jgi:hypothetical protein